jgi:hypothetical protein
MLSYVELLDKILIFADSSLIMMLNLGVFDKGSENVMINMFPDY